MLRGCSQANATTTTSSVMKESPTYTELATRLISSALYVEELGTWMQLIRVIEIANYGVIFLAEESSLEATKESSSANVTHTTTRRARQFAVKCIMRSSDPQQDQFVLRERDLQRRVQHPNVVRVYGIVEATLDDHDVGAAVDVVCIVMDYYPRGDLFKAIVDRGEFLGRDDRVKNSWLQIARGVKACHDQGIFHRDIKPENIFFSDAYTSGLPKVAVADFGLATTSEVGTTFGVGSSYYMSPENTETDVKRRRPDLFPCYSNRANDVWSLTILLVNLAVGRNPWHTATLDDEAFLAFRHNPYTLLRTLPISLELNDILIKAFHPIERRRPSLENLIAMVNDVDRFSLDWEGLRSAPNTVKKAAQGGLWEVRMDQAARKWKAQITASLPDAPSSQESEGSGDDTDEDEDEDDDGYEEDYIFDEEGRQDQSGVSTPATPPFSPSPKTPYTSSRQFPFDTAFSPDAENDMAMESIRSLFQASSPSDEDEFFDASEDQPQFMSLSASPLTPQESYELLNYGPPPGLSEDHDSMPSTPGPVETVTPGPSVHHLPGIQIAGVKRKKFEDDDYIFEALTADGTSYERSASALDSINYYPRSPKLPCIAPTPRSGVGKQPFISIHPYYSRASSG